MRDHLPPDPLLRVATVAVAVSAVLLLGSARLLPGVVVPVVVVAVVAAGAAAAAWPGPTGVRHRGTASGLLVLAGCLALVVQMSRLGSEAPTLGVQLARGLAPALPIVVTGQLLVADRLRHHVSTLALSGATILLALSVQPSRSAVLVLLVAWPAGVLAAARAVELRLRSDAHVDARVDAGGPAVASWARPVVLAGVTTVGAALVALVVQPPQGFPAGHAGGRGDTRGAAGTAAGAGTRSASSYSDGALDMRVRGQLPATPVAQVTADSDPLWRGRAYSYYDGTRWTSDAGVGSAGTGASGPHALLRTTTVTGRPFTTADLTTSELRPLVGFDGVLVAPGTPVMLDVYGRVVPVPGGYRLMRDSGTASSYRVRALPTAYPPTVLAGTPVRGDQATSPVAFQLPDSVTPRTRRLAEQLVGGAADRYQATRAVEDYLRRHATYDLDSPVPPDGADAVDHFLFEAHTGFCEQFAAAEVVLLRSAGVPARLVTGYAYGTTVDGVRTFRTSDLHAWVEVWYPTVGWVQSDPTAGAVPAARHDVLTALRDGLRSATALVVLALLAALSLVVGSWLSWRRRRSRSGRRATAAPVPPVLAAFGRLEDRLGRAGAPRHPAESVRELASRPELAPVREALLVVEQASYAGRPLSDAVARAAVRQLDAHVVRRREPDRT